MPYKWKSSPTIAHRTCCSNCSLRVDFSYCEGCHLAYAGYGFPGGAIRCGNYSNDYPVHLTEVERKERKNIEAKTALVGIYARAECSGEAFESQKALLQAERALVEEERARTETRLSALSGRVSARLSLGVIKEKLARLPRMLRL